MPVPYGKILIALLDAYFALSEKMNKSQEEQLIFYAEQREKFRGENAPGYLPEPPVVDE